MDFFERQEKARRGTKLLVFYFVAAVVFLVAAVYIAVAIIFLRGNVEDSENLVKALWDPGVFLWTVVGTLAVIVIGSITKTLELAGGGSAVAEMFGGRLVNPNTIDYNERKLLNVV